MQRHKSRLAFSMIAAAFFLAAIIAEPSSLPAVSAQSAASQFGTTTERAAAGLQASLDKGEAVDKDSVEANPVADDDSEDAPIKAHPIPIPLPGGLDHVANGVGTRNAGFGTIRLRGTPPGAVAVRAFLYWGTIYDGAAIPINARATFNGRHVIGRVVGVSAPPCWPGSFFAAYRASVIALLTPGIDGDYLVSDLPTSLKDGRDPWLHAPVPAPRPLSEGASLVVIYAHNSTPLSARVFLNQGAAMFFGTVDINNALPQPVPNYSISKHTRLGADGQVGSSTFAILPVTDERTFLGPNPGSLTQIKGPGSGFNGDSDWNGTDGGPLNQLWDTQTSSFFEQLIPPGSTSYTVRYVSNGDCIVAVAHVLGVK